MPLLVQWVTEDEQNKVNHPGVDTGFLESGFMCVVFFWGGGPLLILSHFLKYPIKIKLFHFYRIFENGGGQGVR